MNCVLDIALTGPNSLLDWGLWIILVALGAIIVRIYIKRWMGDARIKLRQRDPDPDGDERGGDNAYRQDR